MAHRSARKYFSDPIQRTYKGLQEERDEDGNARIELTHIFFFSSSLRLSLVGLYISYSYLLPSCPRLETSAPMGNKEAWKD